jgi:RNA polymerase sigma factor (TIGR02999 family)
MGAFMSEESFLKELYQELRRLACQILANERPGHTLQPTALINEAYLKMRASYPQVLAAKNKREFLACAAEAMRRILVDQARSKKAIKRGGNKRRVPLDEAEFAVPAAGFDMEELSNAVTQLEAHDATAAEVVKYKFFVGMKMEQVAETMDQTLSMTNRQWRYARAWLKDYLDSQKHSDMK